MFDITGQSPKVAYYMIIFIRHFQNNKTTVTKNRSVVAKS